MGFFFECWLQAFDLQRRAPVIFMSKFEAYRNNITKESITKLRSSNIDITSLQLRMQERFTQIGLLQLTVNYVRPVAFVVVQCPVQQHLLSSVLFYHEIGPANLIAFLITSCRALSNRERRTLTFHLMTYEALEGKDLNISCLKELNRHKIHGILVNCMLFLLPIALI